MFEIQLVGAAVLAWLGWVIYKAVSFRLMRRAIARGAVYASERGVPLSQSMVQAADYELVQRVRNRLLLGGREFAALPKHEQYGLAILDQHSARLRQQEELRAADADSNQTWGTADEARDRERVFLETKDTVVGLVTPQIETLNSQDTYISVGAVTYAYVAALAMAVSTNAINLVEIKRIVEDCFPGERFAFDVENAWSVVRGSKDFFENIAALTPMAANEVKAGRGEYLVKFNTAFDASVPYAGPERDFSKLSKTWFLEV